MDRRPWTKRGEYMLSQRILSKAARPAVIGLGYVGLPLVVEFAKAGFSVIGIDIDKNKVDALSQGKSYIGDVPSEDILQIHKAGKLHASIDYNILRLADTINICVPTPLRKTKDPDISYIIAAAEEICKYLKKGQLIILESTTYPGTTEEVLLPMLEAKGFKVGKDIYLAFSPERVDPGNKEFNTKNMPKIVGGTTPECTRMAQTLYEQIIDKVIPVSSTRVAEMTKLLENTFRAVNIGLINEIAQMSNKMNIDVWEVIEAASSKPFGFMKFYPGPGIGGHCIPLDPLYLSWKSKLNGFNPRFIELASEVNSSMPEHVVSKIADALNERKKSVSGSKILILGVAYKKDVGDVRESPALDIIKLLQNKGAEILYNDPYIPQLNFDGLNLKCSELTEAVFGSIDCAVVVTDHSIYNYEWIVNKAPLLVDTRNATRGIGKNGARIVKI